MYSSHYQPSKSQQVWFVLFAVILVPLIFHFLYSAFGFNPTDDGTILAQSRRLLSGQLPHRDFISIYPTGSAFFHSLDLLLGGDYAFWFSRLVCWWQMAVVTVCWLLIMEYSTHTKFSWIERLSIFMIGYYLGMHSFPVMASDTIDGLFFSSLGTFLILKKSFLKQLGYLSIGVAVICKQVFLPYAFISIFILNDYKKIGSWLYLILPVSTYIEWIAAGHGWVNLWQQVALHIGWYKTGVLSYFTHLQMYYGIAMGLAAMLINLYIQQQKLIARVYYYSLLIVVVVIMLVIWNSNLYMLPYFILFGVAVGQSIVLIIEKSWTQVMLFGLAVCVSWCCSISTSYNTPALCGAVMFFTCYSFSRMKLGMYFSQAFQYILLVLAAFCTLLFVSIREHHVYRDAADTDDMKYELGDFLYGYSHVFTNRHTYDAMHDLRKITDMIEPAKYAIITDYAGWWSTSQQLNLLSTDWPRQEQLPTDTLMQKVWHELQSQDIHFIIAQRFYTDSLAIKEVPVDYSNAKFALQDSVRYKYGLVKQTAYFNLYSKPFVSSPGSLMNEK